MEVISQKTKRLNAKKRGELIFLIAILTVPTLHWLVFWLYVNMSSFVLAFQNPMGDFSLINFETFWLQLKNVQGEEAIGLPIINTLKYWAVGILLVLPLSIIVAYFIFKKIRFYKFFRIMFFFPTIITTIILVSVYTRTIYPGGLWDQLIRIFGFSVPQDGYLNNPDTATNSILIYTVWTGFGTNVILIGSAMARVPESVFEAAKIEGCGPFREMILIILPLTWPTLSTLILLSLTGFFSASGPILLFRSDGGAETSTLNFWIFKKIYGDGDFGTPGGAQNYGIVSATGLVFSAVWIPVILFARWIMEKIPAVEY